MIYLIELLDSKMEYYMKKSYEKFRLIFFIVVIFILFEIVTVGTFYSKKYRDYKILNTIVITGNYTKSYLDSKEYNLVKSNNYLYIDDKKTKYEIVDVKKNGCKSTGKLNSCKSMYSSPISMKQYIIGVTIQEVSDDLNNIEHIKANMISEKSFAIGRALQRGNVSKIDDNTYAIGIIDSTRDQDYCDYLTGNSCSDGVKGSYKTYGSNLEQAWSESQNLYLYSGKKLIGSVCQNKSYSSDCSCKAGECLFQEEVKNGYETEKVDQILSDQFKNKKAQVLSSEGGYVSSTIITSNTVCSDGTDYNGIDGSNFIYYAQI